MGKFYLQQQLQSPLQLLTIEIEDFKLWALIYCMNRRQKQIIGIELVVITLLLWQYFTDQLTIVNVSIYTLIYLTCMIGWFYFKD